MWRCFEKFTKQNKEEVIIIIMFIIKINIITIIFIISIIIIMNTNTQFTRIIIFSLKILDLKDSHNNTYV